MGRIGVDIYPEQIGVGLEDVTSFSKTLGGSPSNVTVAAARHGRRTAVITRTGADPFGRFLHRALEEFGVDDRFVSDVPALPAPVTFCEIFPPDDFPLYFYRFPKAPDLEIRARGLDLDAIVAADVFWVTGTGLCTEPSRSATMLALRARGQGRGTHRPRPGLPARVLDLAGRGPLRHQEAVSRDAVQPRSRSHVAIGCNERGRVGCAVAAGGGRARSGGALR